MPLSIKDMTLLIIGHDFVNWRIWPSSFHYSIEDVSYYIEEDEF